MLKIHDWENWQTYRTDRGQPPWIKVHRNIMRKPKWVSLSDKERGQLVSIWLLAADNEGQIPDDKQLIKKLCFMSDVPNINKFIELGFVDAKVTPEGRQGDAPEKNREEKNREEKNRYGEFKNVLLTDDEHKKLENKFNSTLQERIEKLSEYMASKGKKYSSHYATILSWSRKEPQMKTVIETERTPEHIAEIKRIRSMQRDNDF